MAAGVIQGNFIGGRPRGLALQQMPQSGRDARPPSPLGARPGPPARLGAPKTAGGRPTAVQAHGANTSFAIDPSRVGLASGGGARLPDAVRGKMEAALGADFSGVRIHVGPQAERIGAVAFTTGSDIYFAPGRFQPHTQEGQALLGHELAHVVQQRQGRVRSPLSAGVAVVQDLGLEAEADRLGRRAAAYVDPRGPNASRAAASRNPVQASNGRFRIQMRTRGATGSPGRILQAFLTLHNPRRETPKKQKRGAKYQHAYEIYQTIEGSADKFTGAQKAIVQQICDLYKTSSGDPTGVLVFDGAHVVVDDDGKYYDEWSGLINSWSYATWNLGARRSFKSGTLPSSHYKNSTDDQYEIRLPRGPGYNFGAILFGVIGGAKRKTWFQVEAHAGTWGYTLFSGIRFGLDVGQHASDYSTHVSSGFQNVGPFGTSPHSDKFGSAGAGAGIKPPLNAKR